MRSTTSDRVLNGNPRERILRDAAASTQGARSPMDRDRAVFMISSPPSWPTCTRRRCACTSSAG